MNRREAILLSAYTGFLLVPDFSLVHEFVEKTLGRPVWSHELASEKLFEEIREKLRPQINELIGSIK
jgi:hypothetical protein